MKHIKLFEKFISEKLDAKAISQKVMKELDTFAQLHAQYHPKEVLQTIEDVLSKYKSFYGGKLTQKVAVEIRNALLDTGNLANDAFRHFNDVDHIIMSALDESYSVKGIVVNEDLRSDIKSWIKKNKKVIDKLADEGDWYSIEQMLVNDFGVDDEDEIKDLVDTFNFIY